MGQVAESSSEDAESWICVILFTAPRSIPEYPNNEWPAQIVWEPILDEQEEEVGIATRAGVRPRVLCRLGVTIDGRPQLEQLLCEG